LSQITSLLNDATVVFIADSAKAHQRMKDVYGTTIKTFALEEREAIVAFLLWAVRENLGLPS
jgi:hypothetical protein